MEEEMSLLNFNDEEMMLLIENEILALKKLKKIIKMDKFTCRLGIVRTLLFKYINSDTRENHNMLREILLALKDEGNLISRAIKGAKRSTNGEDLSEKLSTVIEQLEMIKSKKQIRITYFRERSLNMTRRQLIRKSIREDAKKSAKQKKLQQPTVQVSRQF